MTPKGLYKYMEREEFRPKPKVEANQLTEEELKHLHLETAVSICNKHPKLYQKIFSDKGYVLIDYESAATEILAMICETNPSIKKTLSFLYGCGT